MVPSAYSEQIDFQYTLEFTDSNGNPLEAVQIHGTDGINELNGRVSGSDGSWSFDVRDLESSSPTLYYSFSGYKMEPDYLEVGSETCPDNVCEVVATPDVNETVVLKVEVLDADGNGIDGVTGVISGLEYACPEVTGTDGSLHFSTRKRTAACSDVDFDPLNDYSKVILSAPNGKSCTFTPLQGGNLCPTTSTTLQYLAECSDLESPPQKVEGTYHFEVRATNNLPIITPLKVYPQGTTLVTNGSGVASVSTATLGIGINSSFRVIPVGRYQFYPPEIVVSPGTCPDNVCKFFANPIYKYQQVGTATFQDADGNPVSGIDVGVSSGLSQCQSNRTHTTSKDGVAYFPVQMQYGCDNGDATTLNDKVEVVANQAGCAFSDPSGDAFSFCALGTLAPEKSYTAVCSSPDAERHTISGSVRGPNGAPFPQVKILANGVQTAISRQDGTYSFQANNGDTIVLEASSDDFVFDPKRIEIKSVEEHHSKVNFHTFASTSGLENGYIPEWCDPEDEYEISGIVLDTLGQRLPGATILNNHQSITVTDANGEYKFNVPAQSDNWVTAEYNDEFFDPAGISYPYISCNEEQTNFQITQEGSFIYSGRILDENGNPIPEVQMTFYENGVARTIVSDSSGYYFISVSDGSNCLIRVTDPNFGCEPQEYSSVANGNVLNLHFTCERDLCPLDGSKMEPGQCGCGTPDTDSDNDGVANCNDSCSTDADKVEPGQCGCGNAETDTDGDGTANCVDTCFEDPLKIDAGICGCGIADDPTDTDGDGTLDCNDSCSSDPLKVEPGVCGCGTADTDTDGDGTSDCIDLCVDDSQKTEPGMCGCGISDRDRDGDETPDCEDLCPTDRYKVEPGECGCGIADIDLDGDGVLQCEDLCDTDPFKLEPGECGCGRADTDIDGDETLDCNDECPFDPLKIREGICGCGVDERDTDEDGVPDCRDECMFDPLKTEAGQCGCGEPDIDSDNDSTCDCLDLCPEDPKKLEPGICGCGESDKDSDGDGTADCEDLCAFDDLKLEPGECGCGSADIDFDNDGVLQCDEACDEDPLKTEPGICGCGVPDIDSDSDEELDCNDECPFDPLKQEEGICGCGIADTDTDGDGVADCEDLCILDPLKSIPGYCGCGSVDTDTDGDGIADCLDLCDEDPRKAEPGVCGCGISDRDRDGDGVADCEDLCPTDRGKTAPGACGCGIADVDADGDGVLLCNDQCDTDPNKTAPGTCGCGLPDIDSDGDGTLDCNDSCSTDSKKIEPGVCGCGVADYDSDRDGTLDCLDSCITDPQKIEPGQCGCGIADTDTDLDGVSDCNDLCKYDNRKSDPGVCGCGEADIDKDNDGYFQCQDGCENDPEKVSPGACGCGIADTDSDGDGTPDCQDLCELDSNKIYPGLCGCGEVDTDLNNNGIMDCEEQGLVLEALCVEPPSSFAKKKKRSRSQSHTRSSNKNDNDKKVTICHIPPGNPENAHSITISRSALAAHRAHGDSDGACENDNEHGGNEKVTICHMPPGNPENRQSISISPSALSAHEAHGDSRGACTGDEEPEETIRWKITNPNGSEVPIEIEVLQPDTTERDVYDVGANSEVIFSTTKLSGRNTVVLYHYDGDEVMRVTHPLDYCEGEPITLSGALKGKNGRPIVEGDRMYKILSSFEAGDIEVVAKNNRTKRTYKADVTDPFSWSIVVPGGDYRVFLKSNRFRVSSRPKNYRGSYYWDQGGLHHALRRRDLRFIRRNRKK